MPQHMCGDLNTNSAELHETAGVIIGRNCSKPALCGGHHQDIMEKPRPQWTVLAHVCECSHAHVPALLCAQNGVKPMVLNACNKVVDCTNNKELELLPGVKVSVGASHHPTHCLGCVAVYVPVARQVPHASHPAASISMHMHGLCAACSVSHSHSAEWPPAMPPISCLHTHGTVSKVPPMARAPSGPDFVFSKKCFPDAALIHLCPSSLP